MKLISICIKNFRSIVNTGWKQLSPDNISVIIGQNESGKTSILEALLSFYNGSISEDIIRSDLKEPEVCCCFTDIIDLTKEIPSTKELPSGLIDYLNKTNRINIKRTWIDLKKRESKIELEEKELIEIFENDLKKRLQIKENVEKHIEKYQIKINAFFEKIESFEKEIENFQTEHKNNTEIKTKIETDLPNKNEEEKKQLLGDIKRIEENNNSITKKIEQVQIKIDKIDKEIEEYNGKFIEVKQYIALKNNCDSTESELKRISSQIKTIEQKIGQTPDATAKAALQKELAVNKKKIEELNQQLSSNLKLTQEAKFIIEQVLLGLTYEQSKEKLTKVENINSTFYTRFEIAEFFFNRIPQFVFFGDFANLLPNQIDLDDIESENQEKEGYIAAKNFLKVANIDTELFRNSSSQRILEQKIENTNKRITSEFRDFWSQKVGKSNKIEIEFNLKHHSSEEGEKSGVPYLVFWIKDGSEKLYPVQRSKGVRWFISFYLQLKAAAIESKGNGLVMLIDEPGISLHARAKEDVLKVLEDIKSDITVIYTTHSPYLLNVNTIYRVLAAQRNNEKDDISDTKLLTTHELGAASCDTLSPLYTLMGANFSEQNVISRNNNIILEEMSAFYYLKSFLKLFDVEKEYYLLPATGTTNIPHLANLLLGWGLNFGIIVDDDSAGRKVFNDLKSTLFNNDDELMKTKMIKLKSFKGIEDHFTKEDFVKNVYPEYTEDGTNEISEYLKKKQISKGLLALNFYLSVKNNKINKSDFEKTTLGNITNTLKLIESLELENGII